MEMDDLRKAWEAVDSLSQEAKKEREKAARFAGTYDAQWSRIRADALDHAVYVMQTALPVVEGAQ